MLANFEKRNYSGKERVWVGKYRNLHNLPHWHMESELIYIERGRTIVSHNHQEYSLDRGDAIFLGSKDIHYIKSDEDSIVDMALFDSSIIQELQGRYRLKCAKLKSAYPIAGCFEEIRRELNVQKPFFELQCRELITALMIQIFRREELVERTAGEEGVSISNYKNLLDEIENKYSYITFSDAAAFMGLSEPYFSKFFRKISGMTFSQYLNIVKTEHAIQMLQDNRFRMSVTEVSSRCGFNTIRHFNRIFREITGISPRQLTVGYVLDICPIRTVQDAFNPTLKSSELL